VKFSAKRKKVGTFTGGDNKTRGISLKRWFGAVTTLNGEAETHQWVCPVAFHAAKAVSKKKRKLGLKKEIYRQWTTGRRGTRKIIETSEGAAETQNPALKEMGVVATTPVERGPIRDTPRGVESVPRRTQRKQIRTFTFGIQ